MILIWTSWMSFKEILKITAKKLPPHPILSRMRNPNHWISSTTYLHLPRYHPLEGLKFSLSSQFMSINKQQIAITTKLYHPTRQLTRYWWLPINHHRILSAKIPPTSTLPPPWSPTTASTFWKQWWWLRRRGRIAGWWWWRLRVERLLKMSQMGRLMDLGNLIRHRVFWSSPILMWEIKSNWEKIVRIVFRKSQYWVSTREPNRWYN